MSQRATPKARVATTAKLGGHSSSPTDDSPAASSSDVHHATQQPLYASTEAVYAQLKSYSSSDLVRLQEVARALLEARSKMAGNVTSEAEPSKAESSKAEPSATDPPTPNRVEVTFTCGHRRSVPVASLGPLQVERDLASYRQGACLRCLTVCLGVITDGVVGRLPELKARDPDLAALAERRRYELVRDFVDYLGDLPRQVLETYAALQFEVTAVLQNVDTFDWWPGRRPLQDVVWRLATMSNDDLIALDSDLGPRPDDPARSRALATLLDYREYKEGSPFERWLIRVVRPERFRGFE